MTTDTLPELGSIEPNQYGYRDFQLGKFSFSRDEYFVHIRWPNGTSHARRWTPSSARSSATWRGASSTASSTSTPSSGP